LRFGSERDIPEILIAHQDDPRLYARIGDQRPPSGAELGREAELAPAQRAAAERVELTIVELGGDDCRGRISVNHVDRATARAGLRVWVAPQVRGRGYARDALRIAGQWLLDACGLVRIELLTETDNQAMQHAALAAGFQCEGVLRSYWLDPRGRLDAAAFSLLASDLVGRA